MLLAQDRGPFTLRVSSADDLVDHSQETRPRSWNLEAADGSFATVIAWHSGQSWFDALMDALAANAGENTRRAAKVSPGTLLMVARADWLSADADTGRGVTTAHETVAAQLGMSAKTVQRARKLLEELGFAVTVVRGRYLTRAERQAARSAHGGRQLRAASVRALTLPRPAQSVENVQLPRRGDKPPLVSVKKFLPKRASARKAATKKGMGASRDRVPRSIPLQRLAHELSAAIPWLSRDQHIGNVCAMLERCGIEPKRWTARALLDTINRGNLAGGIVSLAGSDQKDPIAYLSWMIRRTIDHTEITPVERQAIARAEQAEHQKQRMRERQAETDRVSKIDRDEIAAIIARMKAEMSERARSARYVQKG